MSDLVTRLFDSDEASKLTNEAAREIEALEARIAELEGEVQRAIDFGHSMYAAAEKQAWNAALEAAELKLRVYAPNLVDGPENDVGYYYGYHSALDRIRAMKEENND